MTESSRDPAARARKNASAILTRLHSVGQVNVAAALNVSESLVSKWKTADLELVAGILAQLGLKVVPETMRCYEPQQIEAIFTLAKARLNDIKPEQLTWEDGE